MTTRLAVPLGLMALSEIVFAAACWFVVRPALGTIVVLIARALNVH